jgi:hypothetical protein
MATYTLLATALPTGVITYSVQGTLPAGITAVSSNEAGVSLSGTPTGVGVFTLTSTATNVWGEASKTTVVTVVPGTPVWVNWGVPATTRAGVPFIGFQNGAQSVPASSITYTLRNGTLPPGMTLSLSGYLSGTPTVKGEYAWLVIATNTVGTTPAPVFSTITVMQGPPVFVNWTPVSGVYAGWPYAGYNYTAVCIDPCPSVTFSLTSGTMPPGIISSPSGLISGIPRASGVYTFTVSAAYRGDSVATDAPTVFTVLAGPPVFTAWTPVNSTRAGDVYTGYNFSAFAIPASAVTYGVVSGTLPLGLSLDSAMGLLSGTSRTAGTFTFSVAATNSVGSTTVPHSATIVVSPAIVPSTVVSFAVLSRLRLAYLLLRHAEVQAAYQVAVSYTASVGRRLLSSSLPRALRFP